MGVYGLGSFSKRKDGRCQYRITIDGKRKTFYGADENECLKKYKAYIKTDEQEKPKTSTLFNDVMNEWYKLEKEPTTSPSSKLNYEIYIKKIKSSLLGTSAIETIKPRDIQIFFNQPEISRLKKKTYFKAIFKGVFDYAIDNEIITKNPFRKLKFENEYIPEETIKVFCKQDIEKIIQFAQQDEDFGTQILLMLYTGIRRGELCAIHYSDINFKERYISIHRAVSKDEFGYFLNNTTKTKKSRIIPIDEAMCNRLKQCSHSKCIWNGKEFLSPHTFENAYERFFTRLNNSLNDDDKVAYLSPHKMRHTFATYTLKGSNNLRGVQEILGHSRSSTTEIYTHINTDDKRKVIEQLTY